MRSVILQEVDISFPDLSSHVRQMYTQPSSLVFIKGMEPVVISSEQGVHQGDPLGPVLFSMGIHPILIKLQESHKNVVVLAYLDDVYLLGDQEECLKAPSEFKSLSHSIGLQVSVKFSYLPLRNLCPHCLTLILEL